jgi:guanidinoacetate N-methyltransferase
MTVKPPPPVVPGTMVSLGNAALPAASSAMPIATNGVAADRFVVRPKAMAAPQPSQPKAPLFGDAPSGAGSSDHIYVSDRLETLEATRRTREGLYTSETRAKWADADARFLRTEDGEEVLVIEQFEVMREFERPYMREIARTAAAGGGIILNVGFGLGIIDNSIEEFGDAIVQHHIVELNKQIVQRAETWRDDHPRRERIFVHQGDWKDALRMFKEQGLIFDAVAYDAFPLEARELHRDVVPFLEELLRLELVRQETGAVTFYMDSADGFGTTFLDFIRARGVSKADLQRIDVTLPKDGNQYWSVPYFFVPRLSGISYREP